MLAKNACTFQNITYRITKNRVHELSIFVKEMYESVRGILILDASFYPLALFLERRGLWQNA